MTSTIVSPKLYKELQDNIQKLTANSRKISSERKLLLNRLGDYIARCTREKQLVRLTVICTHNSRRSHLGQAWLLAAADHFGLQGIQTFSGGTEATAFHPNAIAALQRAGFHISTEEAGSDNPTYQLSTGPEREVEYLFSKKFDHPLNPVSSFAAIMVCSDADEACPFVPGADARFAIRYEDPKVADGSEEAADVYDTRCMQIGREMLYAMKRAKKNLDRK
ncbi:MAG: protein-tyrosine-phosphatase [Bacteroidota bacterium]